MQSRTLDSRKGGLKEFKRRAAALDPVVLTFFAVWRLRVRLHLHTPAFQGFLIMSTPKHLQTEGVLSYYTTKAPQPRPAPAWLKHRYRGEAKCLRRAEKVRRGGDEQHLLSLEAPDLLLANACDEAQAAASKRSRKMFAPFLSKAFLLQKAKIL